MTQRWFGSTVRSKYLLNRQAKPELELLEDRTVPATLIALTTAHRLLTFDSATPGQVSQSPIIKGLAVGEQIMSIDARPANGVVYGLSSLNLLYTIDISSGRATQVGAGPAAFGQTGTRVAIDFNPRVDRLRVVSNTEENFRINPNTGTIVQADTALAYAPGDVNENINPSVTAVAYDRNFQGATLTTLFGIDSGTDQLVRIGGVDGTPSPDGGQLNTIGGLGFNAQGRIGFDITANGDVFAAMINGTNIVRLYTINLTTGQATSLGRIGNGSAKIISMTSLPRQEIVWATSQNNRLVSFSASDPNTLLSAKAITGLLVGETILGMDFRPASGQLFALTSQNRVVTIDTITAVATQIGSPIVTSPQFLASSPIGFDFNPTVDRLRLVNVNDDNLRFNPLTNTVVDSDSDPGNGNTPDGNLSYDPGDTNNGANPNIVGVAYDRNDNDGATDTTLFGIDSTLNNLVRIGGVDGTPSPNDGLLFTIGSLGVDPTDLVGFDIVGAGTGMNGAALASMQLNGDNVSKLFSINLTAGLTNQPVGTATLIGTIGHGELYTAMAIAPPKIQFSKATYTATETGGVATIAITRTGGSGTAATVTLDTFDGSAFEGEDYTGVFAMVVNFAAGETTKLVNIAILNGNGNEPAETVNLTLSAPTGGTTVLGERSTAVLTITDSLND
jgi:hypothetical protein